MFLKLSLTPSLQGLSVEQRLPLARFRLTLGAGRVGTGVFGAEMKVRLLNDGPVTIELCTDKRAPDTTAP